MDRSTEKQRSSLSLSIRSKFILINITLFVSVFVYAVYEQMSLDRLESLERAANENLRSSVDLLMLRRHEKDFLARKEQKYAERFDTTAVTLDQRLLDLNQTLISHELNLSDNTSKISQAIESYEYQFSQIVQQVNAIENPNPSVGLIAVLDKRRNELKHAVEKEANLALELALLELVEKDFHYLAHTNDQTSLAFDGALDVFTPYAQNTDTTKQAYLNYRDAVEKLLVANTRLGLTEELGLKGELRRTVHQAEQAINGVQLEINTAISQASSDTKNTLHLFGFAIVILLSALLALIGKSVLTRIKAINQMMESIAKGDGDLTVRMNAKGTDELAQLSHSFDAFISKLHANIKDLSGVMTVLTDSSCSSEQAAQKSMSNAEKQKQQSESVATAVNELVMTSNEVAANIENAALSAEKIKGNAHHALQDTHATDDSIQVLVTNIEESQTLIDHLEEQSREINQVVTTIQGIAEQTNLLALNAAIEAARAGEQGRGFAVVADEVRNLAGRTQDSTKEIQLMINNLQEGSRNAIQTMEVCAETSQSTVTESQNASEALQQIVIALESISSMSHQIATAAAEQTQVSDDISKRINMIEESGNQLSGVVTESHNSTQTLASLSNELEAWVNRFEVKH